MATKGWVGFIASLAILLSIFAIGLCDEDVPCDARDVGIEGRSIVCVCTATRCDTITREDPPQNTYVMYTSSNSGKRFEKSFGPIRSTTDPNFASKIAEPIDSHDTFDDEDSDLDLFKELVEPKDIVSDDLPVDLTNDFVDLKALIEKYRNKYRNDEQDEDHLDDDPSIPETTRTVTLTINTDNRRQTIEGFGGSVTDAASINWRKLSNGAQQQLIDSYFGPKGLEYNLIRVPIAGSDFSEYPYTYNEYPWYDHELSNFTLTEHDYLFKLPMIKSSKAVATADIKITASTWSPPIWMKTNERITGFGQLKPEFFQTYADYHLRFLEEYDKEDVKIWALTTTNEPLNGIVPLARFNSLGFAPWQMAKYVAENLGPTIKNSRFSDTLILGVDDQRYMLPIYLRGMAQEDPKSLDYLDGIAIHYYGNFIPPQILSLIQRQHPGKILLSTEACEGPMPWDLLQVEIGSWRRARRYTTSIMQDLNHHVVGWIDWNLCLDPNGGPNWADNFVDAPILVYGDTDEFIKQPMFYAMGHFSKFIPRGSQVVRVSRSGDLLIENVAVVKPDNNIVIVIQNRRTSAVQTTVYISPTRFIEFEMEPESLKTIEFRP